ncbi:MAG: hypothetical protein ACLFU1_06955 [Alphaproteobacteria bacterium]
MTTLSFTDKTILFNYLANTRNWENTFNLDFFTDESRRWSCKTHGHLRTCTNETGTKSKVEDTSTGQHLFIERLINNHVLITDEFGRTIEINGTNVSTQDGIIEQVVPIKSSSEFGLEQPDIHAAAVQELGIIARFHSDGSKTIFIQDVGHRIDLKAEKNVPEPLQAPGQFFHQISLNHTTLKEWQIDPAYALIYAKLVVARDFGIEPELRALNELDEEKAVTILTQHLQKGPEQDHEQIGITDAEKPWTDTTEFTGYHTALPKRFVIKTREGGFDLATTSAAKHSIVAQGGILSAAQDTRDVYRIRTIQRNTVPRTILHFLDKGRTISDHLGEEWNFVVLQSAAAKHAIQSAKETARNIFALDYRDFAAINYAPDLSVLAIKTNTLKVTKARYDASLKARGMIVENSSDARALLELLDIGADLRFIDPEGAAAGNSFSSLAEEAGNAALLSAIEERHGMPPRASISLTEDDSQETLDI